MGEINIIHTWSEASSFVWNSLGNFIVNWVLPKGYIKYPTPQFPTKEICKAYHRAQYLYTALSEMIGDIGRCLWLDDLT